MSDKNNPLQVAVFGGGCFWCTEAIFKSLKGVESVLPGYAGGTVPKPTYEEVCNGTTGHAEVIEIKFDPSLITFRDLLEVFFATHDPTTLNRQGNDVGDQYRSVILYSSPEQKDTAEKFIAEVETEKIFSSPVVTQIKPLAQFYEAENYHRDYYERNKNKPYCQVVINPKLAKFKKKFAEKLKQDAQT